MLVLFSTDLPPWKEVMIEHKEYLIHVGDLFWLWSPYPNYYKLDKAYGDLNNPWTVAQSYGNLIEVAIYYIAFGFSQSTSIAQRQNSVFLVFFSCSSFAMFITSRF
eukprot:TRINITY_DN1846_c0_g1_i4.p1 TRINITY_DN1846_c0_g1~~TRINITY_DN1846_c0_g1_i4.p1  ORF type:complete len:106 (+),score=11.74 TRINITY_DN1846_c0_g1_i4:128-445(+)